MTQASARDGIGQRDLDDLVRVGDERTRVERVRATGTTTMPPNPGATIGPAGRQRVRGRAGRRGDDDAVGAQPRDLDARRSSSSNATTRADAPRETTTSLSARYEPTTRPSMTTSALQRRPALDARLARERRPDRLAHRSGRRARQEAEPPELHAEHRHLGLAEQVDRLQNRPVAAERDDQRRLADLGGRDAESGKPDADGVVGRQHGLEPLPDEPRRELDRRR